MKKSIFTILSTIAITSTMLGCHTGSAGNTETTSVQTNTREISSSATETNTTEVSTSSSAASRDVTDSTKASITDAASTSTVGQVISTEGEHIITGTIQGQLLITVPNVKLVLDGVTIQCNDGSGILSETGELNIELRGENYVSGSDHGIQAKDTLIISGTGSVDVTAVKDGLHAGDELHIDGGIINVVESNEGIEAPSILIQGGTSTIFATDDGINAAVDDTDTTIPSILITGGETIVYTTSDGIDSNGTFDVTGGTVAVFINVTRDGNTLDIDAANNIQLPMLNVTTPIATGTKLLVNNYSITTKADATSLSLIIPDLVEGNSYTILANDSELASVTASTQISNQNMRGGGRGNMRFDPAFNQ